MKKIFLLLFISLFNLNAQQTLGSIEVEGLRRTRLETLLGILKINEGDPWNEEIPQVLDQRIRQAGIFQPDFTIDVQENSDLVDIKISLKDKWTLLPIPVFSLSEGKSSGGLVVVESNAMGRQHLAVLTGMVGEEGSLFFGIYRIPRIWDSSWDYLQSATYNDNPRSFTNLTGDDSLGSYQSLELMTSGRFIYNFTDALSAGFTLGLNYQDTHSADQIEIDQDGETGLILGVRANLDRRTIYPLFTQGIEYKQDGDFTLFPSGNVWTTKGELTLTLRPWDWMQAGLSNRFFATTGDVRNYLLLGKMTSHKTLPDESVAAKYFTGMEGALEFRLVSLPFGSITLPAYFEAGVMEGLDEDNPWYTGWGAGMRFYVDKVAVPAMGLEFQYSNNSNNGNVTFSIGTPY